MSLASWYEMMRISESKEGSSVPLEVCSSMSVIRWRAPSALDLRGRVIEKKRVRESRKRPRRKSPHICSTASRTTPVCWPWPSMGSVVGSHNCRKCQPLSERRTHHQSGRRVLVVFERYSKKSISSAAGPDCATHSTWRLQSGDQPHGGPNSLGRCDCNPAISHMGGQIHRGAAVGSVDLGRRTWSGKKISEKKGRTMACPRTASRSAGV